MIGETHPLLRAVGDLEMPIRKARALAAAVSTLSDDMPRGGDTIEHVAQLAAMLNAQPGEVGALWQAAHSAEHGKE